MPLIPVEDDPGLRGVLGSAPPQEVPPAASETAGAAFRQGNILFSIYQAAQNSGPFTPEPDHNPLDLIRGTRYFQHHADRFAGSGSGAETQSIMAQIDREEADRRILDASGGFGVLMQIAAGILDPTIAFPTGVAVKSVEAGYVFGKAALRTGAAGALQVGTQEAILQASQQTRPTSETVLNIGAGTILSGLIGGGAVALLTRAERQVMERAVDGERAAIDVHAGRAADAGAAATDTRQLVLETTGLERVPLVNRLSTTRRTLSSESVEARRAMADLAETPYQFKENVEGVATTQGPALDRIARMQILGTRTAVGEELDRLFSEYRYGGRDTWFPRMRGEVERFFGGDESVMTYSEFKREVSRALMERDQHAVPQVQQAAQFIRSNVFEPWHKRAVEIGLLDEGLPLGAESYFHRVYNKELIVARRPEFTSRVTSYLLTDQANKAAAKDRITAYQGGLEVAEETIAKLTSQIETARAGLERVEIRADEAGAGTRAVLEPSVRRRTNTLADQASGREAKIADLEDRLAREIANVAAVRKKIEAELAAWQGKSVSEAKAAMKARQKAEDERIARATAKGEPAPTDRLTQADAAIDRTVKRIIASDRDISEQELRARANEITDRILGSPDGRLPYDAPAGGPKLGPPPEREPPRGALATREFAIPDALIADFLEDDVEQVVGIHLRTMVPDVLLTERFGDVLMTDRFKAVNEDYARLSEAAKSEAARVKLEKERQAVIRDLAATRDRVRSVYGWSVDMRNMARVANGAKAVNNLTSMGMAAVSSLPDLAGVVFRHGLTSTFRDGWMPFFSKLAGNEGWEASKRQWQSVGIATETYINARQHALDDVMDVYRPQSRVERTLQAVTDKFFVANMLAPFTDFSKMISANVASAEFMRWAEAAAKGTATKRQITDLAAAGIDRQMASRIWAQIDPGGTVKGAEMVGSIRLPNTADWADQGARMAFEGAVARDVDISVVTPGAEKPLTMSHPVASLLFQFKSFTASATERILIANLQRRDAQVLQGLVFSLGLGMLSYKLNSIFGGQKTSDRPQDWVKEGISRSGMLGWFEEGNAFASKATRGGVDIYRMIGADKPLSRFASRSAADMLLGPTVGKMESLLKVTGSAAAGDWKESDTTALRRMLAFQNLFWLRGALNQVERGANDAFGVQMRERP